MDKLFAVIFIVALYSESTANIKQAMWLVQATTKLSKAIEAVCNHELSRCHYRVRSQDQWVDGCGFTPRRTRPWRWNRLECEFTYFGVSYGDLHLSFKGQAPH